MAAGLLRHEEALVMAHPRDAAVVREEAQRPDGDPHRLRQLLGAVQHRQAGLLQPLRVGCLVDRRSNLTKPGVSPLGIIPQKISSEPQRGALSLRRDLYNKSERPVGAL